MYYSTGCTHAPHHVAKEWADKYKGEFDDGWDVLPRADAGAPEAPRYRAAGHRAHRATGSVPRLGLADGRGEEALRPPDGGLRRVPENADWNVGRLLDAIEEMGELDNTLVIYIWGDNGASMEGTLTGSFNETTFFNGVVLDAERAARDHREVRRHRGARRLHTAPHFAAAWAHANNTPFQWGKQMGSHLGGTRDPMVVAWPNRIAAGGDLRTQFTHCIDIAPTILELVGIPEPKTRRRDRPGADGRHELRLHLRRAATPRSGTRAVLRDVRQPRDLPGRLVGVRPARQGPVGLHAGDPEALRPGALRPG